MKKKFFSVKIFSLLLAVYVFLSLAIRFGIVNSYWAGIFKITLINIVLVVSLNLATGFLGQLTLAHSAFMAIGAYISVVVTKGFLFPSWFEFPLALLISGVVAMLFALLVGVSAMCISGNYLVIMTLAFNEIIRNLIINLNLQGGANGCHGIAHYSNFTIVYVCAVAIVAFIYLLRDSKYGRAVVCIPQNELLAKSCGVDTFYCKLVVFSLAAFFAGVAGGLYAHEMVVIEPNMFDYRYSLELLTMVIIGGLGSISGSVISAIVLTILPYLFSFLFDLKKVIYIAGMIFIIMYMPGGFFSDYKAFISEFVSSFKLEMSNSKLKKQGEKA